MVYNNIEEATNLVRQASYAEYESKPDIYFDDRIPDALEGRTVDYIPGRNPLQSAPRERGRFGDTPADRQGSAAVTSGIEPAGSRESTGNLQTAEQQPKIKPAADYGGKNTVVTAEDYAEIRRKLKAKLRNSDKILNAGLLDAR